MAEESLKEESIQSPPRRAPRGFVARRKVFVLVTCFILIILALGGMSVYLWWSNKQLRANQEQQERQVARLFEQAQRLEQENQGLKQNNDARIAELNEQIKQLTAPQPNWPIYDVYAVAFLRQSGGARKVNEIQLSADVKGFTLILNPENPRRYTDYTIEILDSHDQIVWRGEELKRNALDGFNLTVNREGLPESRYTIKVYGKTAAGSQLIDEYPIVIK
jgi:cell division protein FtsB